MASTEEVERNIYIEEVIVPSGQAYSADREQGHWSEFESGETCWVVWSGEPGDFYTGREGECRTEEAAEALADKVLSYADFWDEAEDEISAVFSGDNVSQAALQELYQDLCSKYPLLSEDGDRGTRQAFNEIIAGKAGDYFSV